MSIDQNTKKELIAVFERALSIDKSRVTPHLGYKEIPEWDSISHMILINEIETTFEISIPSDQMVEMNSFSNILLFLDKNLLKKPS
ncbi:acyl carrier protein [Robertkochia aurantiaca]|uniref:acyl carrier protein n=1 Tax=Robertkochia aurantiaca TaxID=2873700 RepID=UPI001CCACF2F|nr:acyl carrier protein [Robertkochia sp. 3YJGBD-33]